MEILDWYGGWNSEVPVGDLKIRWERMAANQPLSLFLFYFLLIVACKEPQQLQTFQGQSPLF